MNTRPLNLLSKRCCIVWVWLLPGCATLDSLTSGNSDYIPYQLTSTPSGSTILVNGEIKGSTPLTLRLEAKKRWVGILVAPGGWKYENNFYFIEAVPSTNDEERYSSESTYISPRNIDQSNQIHFQLPIKPIIATKAEGFGKILGVKESLLPTMKSTGYVRILQINGKPLDKWGATPHTAELPVGYYSLATLCKWDMGIGGEVKIENMWPLKIYVENGKTYQLEANQLPNMGCGVNAKVSDK